MKKRLPLIILAGGLAAMVLAVVVGVFIFRDDDDGGDGPDAGSAIKEKIPSVSRAGTVGGPDPVTRLTAGEASLRVEELPANYEVDVPNTFVMNVTTFSSSYWFKSDREGQERAIDWKVIGGYEVVYQPKGQAAEVLNGFPNVRIETYQFVDQDGARKAWAHLDNVLKTTSGSDPVEARGLANHWSAYRIILGTVGTSDKVAVYHRYSFRRGNTIVSVQTWGPDELMNIDPARNIAVTIDEKLLGTRPAVEPTPLPTPGFTGR